MVAPLSLLKEFIKEALKNKLLKICVRVEGL